MRLFAIIVCAVLSMGFQEKDEPKLEQGADVSGKCDPSIIARLPKRVLPTEKLCRLINQNLQENPEVNAPVAPDYEGTLWRTSEDWFFNVFFLNNQLFEVLSTEDHNVYDYAFIKKNLMLLDQDPEKKMRLLYIKSPAYDFRVVLISSHKMPITGLQGMMYQECTMDLTEEEVEEGLYLKSDQYVREYYQNLLIQAGDVLNTEEGREKYCMPFLTEDGNYRVTARMQAYYLVSEEPFEMPVAVEGEPHPCGPRMTKFYPEHAPIQPRLCEYLATLPEEERKSNSPKSELLKNTIWQSTHYGFEYMHLYLVDNVLVTFSTKKNTGKSGRLDHYKRLVLLEEDVENDMALFYVREPKTFLQWHEIIMLLRRETYFGDMSFVYSSCSVDYDEAVIKSRGSDEEIRSDYEAYVKKSWRAVKEDNRPPTDFCILSEPYSERNKYEFPGAGMSYQKFRSINPTQ